MRFIIVDEKRKQAKAAEEPATAARAPRQVADMVASMSIQRATEAAPKESDRRWAKRKRTETPAYVVHAKAPQGQRCTVRDTSSSGALIEIAAGADRFSNPAEDIPDRMTLVFVSYKERSEVACAVMRRNGRMLGLRYVGPFRTFASPAASKAKATAGKKR